MVLVVLYLNLIIVTMKLITYKSLILAGSFLILGGLTAESVFAQRGGGNRSGGNGGGSRGSSGGSISRAASGGMRSNGNISRGNATPSRSSATINRSNAGTLNRNTGRGNANISRSPQRQNAGNNIAGRSGRPGYNRSVTGRPGYGRPGYNRPGYNRPGYGRPGYHRPGYNRPYYGFYGRPNYGYYNYYRPYLGFSFNVLPFGYYPFMFGADQFYYSGGLFYRQYENQYKVVDPPVGAEINEVPEEASEIVINGQTYYEYKGVYYTKMLDASGKTIYTVAGKDGVLNTEEGAADLPEIGASLSELPEGSNEVTLKGERYFVSPDGVYFEQVNEGTTISYRVVGH